MWTFSLLEERFRELFVKFRKHGTFDGKWGCLSNTCPGNFRQNWVIFSDFSKTFPKVFSYISHKGVMSQIDVLTQSNCTSIVTNYAHKSENLSKNLPDHELDLSFDSFVF